eukprot:TRINITY_DN87592_c0_g1_i1.p1 TRINITY_DN87592_c0_g1~~TRINITY_DN87592_c0_g1_i1.p1  ORF type:complete len:679 (-),score=217.98 TRINITY_DN87592_c0_g1_i1:21-2057(-)
MQTLGSMWRVVVAFAVLASQAQGTHQVRHLRASAGPQTLAVPDDDDAAKQVQLAEQEAEETVAQAEASGEPSQAQDTDDDLALPADGVSLLGEMASLEKADMPFGEYAPSCVNHLKKIARTMGDMYGDIQIKHVLKNECHADKESPSAVETGFDKYKDCLNFADKFPRAMKEERRGKNGFEKLCKQFFQLQDRQETIANVASAAKDAAKAALADGKSPEEIAAAAAKAAYKAAIAAGKSPEEARAMASAAAAKVMRDQARAAGKSKAEIEAAGRAAMEASEKAVSEEQKKKKSDKKKSKDESDEDEKLNADEGSMENATDDATEEREEREATEPKVSADPRRSQESWWSWLNRKLFGGHPMYDSKDLSKADESDVADEQLSTEDANESLLDDMNATNSSKLDEDKRRKRDKDKYDDMDPEDVVKEAEKEESNMDNLDVNASANASAGHNESEDEDAASAEEQDELEAKEDRPEEQQRGSGGRGRGGLFDWLFGSGEDSVLGKTYGAPRTKGAGKKSKKNKNSDSEDDADDADSSSNNARRNRGDRHKTDSTDDISAELAKGVTAKDLETLDGFIDDDASETTADIAYINSCVVHLRKVAKVIDKSYSDAQAEEALESQCNLDKEFGSVRHESFKRRKECKVFAKLFLKARLQELNGGKTSSYKKLCSWYYKYEDAAFD